MDFNEKFKTYSNTALFRITDNPDDYQPKAVETAKIILSDRQLTEEEIRISRSELETEKQEKLNEQAQKREAEEKLKNIGKSILDHVNPIQREATTTEKTIQIISMLFCGLFLFELYIQWGMISMMFADNAAGWDFSMPLYFLPLLVIPAAIILFYQKKKTGWLLLTIYLTYSAVSAFGLLIMTINRKPAGIPALDNLIPADSPITHFLSLAFFAGIIWSVSRENIRAVYLITRHTVILTISVTAAVVALGLIMLF